MGKGLSTLEEVQLREIWKHEERDFTIWLSDPDNLDLLPEELGMSRSPEEVEKRG